MIPARQQFGGLGNRMFQNAYLYAQVKDGVIPDIYVQDCKYFDEYRDEIREIYGKGVKPIDKVSLHIRRGDYVNHPFYVDLTTTDYYDKAIAMFPNETFLVFCADRQNEQQDVSDRQWCMDWLDAKGINYEMWYGDNEVEDFNAMAGCKAHIMANSSFSYWASYVGGGRTIAPKKWYSDGVERTVCPNDWERI